MEFKLCDNFKINRLNCCTKGDTLTAEDFTLIKTKHKKYNNLVPSNHDYIFLKVLDNGEIISVVGKLLPYFGLKSKDLLGKPLNKITKCQPLFNDYIEPLFLACMEKNSAYQFDFELKGQKFSCSLFPCSIPVDITSVDIVIRPSHDVLTAGEKDSFILE